MPKLKTILIFLLVYFLSTGLSFAALNLITAPAQQTTQAPLPTPKKKSAAFKIDPSLPRDAECPLNGAMYTKNEKAKWETRRPLGIMIENHEEARPQSGLSDADVVFEAIAEGGITRLLSIYYCLDSETVGPVRSARTYFLDLISGFGNYPLYAHVGGANCDEESGSGCQNGAPADAIGQISQYGWAMYNDINQFSVGFPTFWRDYEIIPNAATEHTVYTTTEKLWKIGEKRSLTNVDEKGVKWDEKFEKWKFKDDAKDTPASFIASFPFWANKDKYVVKWEYDKTTNSYKRFTGGVPHIDKNSDEQLTAKNVVIAFMKESKADDGYDMNAHLLYGTKGEGEMTLFQDGKSVNGEWRKINRTAQIKFFDDSGTEIKFNRGPIWIEILPVGTKISL